MREYLFRGKREYNGEWVQGHLLTYPDGACFICCVGDSHNVLDKFWVDPDTVGQFTGLMDKNGKRIFEGDVIKTHYINAKKSDFVEQVVFHNGRFCSLYKLSEHGRMWANLPDGVPYLLQDKTPQMVWCEIIGNIHDNPELLEGGTGNV